VLRYVGAPLGWTLLLMGPAPMAMAWAYKLAHYGYWTVSEGNPRWNHTFQPTLGRREHDVAHALGVAHLLVQTKPYVSVGMAPTLQHWRMGLVLLAQSSVVLAALWGAWRTWQSARGRGLAWRARPRRR
jgi:hypothetical protein